MTRRIASSFAQFAGSIPAKDASHRRARRKLMFHPVLDTNMIRNSRVEENVDKSMMIFIQGFGSPLYSLSGHGLEGSTPNDEVYPEHKF